MMQDPFDGTEMERRVLVGPNCQPDPKDKYPQGRAIAAAFWASYFALHWLLLLGVVETTWNRSAATLYFFLVACIITVQIAAHEASPEAKK